MNEYPVAKMSKIKILLSVLATLGFITLSPSVHAHSKMQNAIPEDGDMVEIGHNNFAIMFNRKVRFTKVSLHRSVEGKTLQEMVEWDAQEGHIEAQHIESITIGDLPRGFVKEGMFEFDPLDVGIYHIEWIVVAQDGHVMEGAEHFEVLENTASTVNN